MSRAAAESVVELLTAGAADAGSRIDVFIATRLPHVSRTVARRLCDEGEVLLKGVAARPSSRVGPGDPVSIRIPPPRPSGIAAEALPLRIVYEDGDLLVVDKPPGMPAHPSIGHESGTLVNAILHLRPDIAGVGGEQRPGIVHRLDKDTSGLVIVAKHDVAHRNLAAQLSARTVRKTYLALAEGTPQPAEALIDAPIARDDRHRKRMAVVPGGREARTRYRVVERFAGASLLELDIETGRTHQIRVHLAAIGHAVLGDSVYGTASPLIGRQALHAWRLRFRSPSTGDEIAVEAEPPADFAAALTALRG